METISLTARIIMWSVGIFITAINVWGMFILRNIKQDNKDVSDKCVNHKNHINNKVHQLEVDIHEKFVSKSYLNDMKREINGRFDNVETLLNALIQRK